MSLGFKSSKTIRNVKSEGSYPLITDIEVRKYVGSNGIRYPSSPYCQRWMLNVVYSYSVTAYALNIPPGYYGRKTKT